jgi:hypothetical protein
MSKSVGIPPVRVVLRNKSTACITHGVSGLSPFTLMGHIEGDCSAVHLWKRGGGWLEQPTPHSLDIVGVFKPAGEVTVFQGLDIPIP